MEKDEREDKEVEHDFETIHNIAPVEIELSSSMRTTIRHWNMIVQWWLVVNVYKLIPIRNKLIRGIIVMIVSGFWHGVHPGWYATFLSAPFLMLAEDGMEKGVRQRLTSDRQRRVYDFIAGVLAMRYFEYYAVGAFFLYYGEIWRYWSSLYFYGHVSLAVFIIVGQGLSWFSKDRTKKPHQS